MQLYAFLAVYTVQRVSSIYTKPILVSISLHKEGYIYFYYIYIQTHTHIYIYIYIYIPICEDHTRGMLSATSFLCVVRRANNCTPSAQL